MRWKRCSMPQHTPPECVGFWSFFQILMNLHGSVLLTPTKVYHAELATWDVGLFRHVLAFLAVLAPVAPVAPVAFTSLAFPLLCLYFSAWVSLGVSYSPIDSSRCLSVTITTAVCWKWRRQFGDWMLQRKFHCNNVSWIWWICLGSRGHVQKIFKAQHL